jgi:HEAT repeat protein
MMTRVTDQMSRNHPDLAEVRGLIAEFAEGNGLRRKEARLKLVHIGRPAVPALVEALADPKDQVRWEAAKALTEIRDPKAAPALVESLKDENFGVRWLAAEGLISAGKRGLVPLLQALENHSDSAWLREGAHHVIRTLVGREDLHDLLSPVLIALDDVEPVIEVPPAAQKALDELA